MLFLAVNSEIQELKDLLLAEQEEKNKLQVKLQNAENECECPMKNWHLVVILGANQSN